MKIGDIAVTESGAIVECIPICPHYTNTQLEKMGHCPICEPHEEAE